MVGLTLDLPLGPSRFRIRDFHFDWLGKVERRPINLRDGYIQLAPINPNAWGPAILTSEKTSRPYGNISHAYPHKANGDDRKDEPEILV